MIYRGSHSLGDAVIGPTQFILGIVVLIQSDDLENRWKVSGGASCIVDGELDMGKKGKLVTAVRMDDQLQDRSGGLEHLKGDWSGKGILGNLKRVPFPVQCVSTLVNHFLR
jgi:hypothetical protein